MPGGFDPALYASERVWIEAEDGVKVPVSIAYRRDSFHGDAKNPLYVYGYGSYGYALPVGFSPTRLSLLDRGLVLAYAHIRGGGELGDTWHDAGKMMVKRNTFTDFVATVIEQLVVGRLRARPSEWRSKAAARGTADGSGSSTSGQSCSTRCCRMCRLWM